MAGGRTWKCSPHVFTTRGSNRRNAGLSPSLAPMNSRSTQGAATKWVSTARSAPRRHSGVPASSLATASSPGTCCCWLVHRLLPSKDMTPIGSATFCSPGFLSSLRTWAATVCRSPAVDCPANSRHSVVSDTFWGTESRLRTRAPKSVAKSSIRLKLFSPQANAATNSPNSPNSPWCSYLLPRACRGSSNSGLHSISAQRNARRRCPGTPLMLHCSRLLRLFPAEATWGDGARQLHPAAFSRGAL
ncbi:hypothetical protein [Hyalangium minutum]|uniref:hypothetical protein n=1 Tax=Hyalangium minutum TaxID=394096 RepID=UPI0005C51CB8|nr:hypothetical protein [Hyalangium minutum]